MNHDQAKSAIVTSSVLVGGIYLYRRLVEQSWGRSPDDASNDTRRLIRQLAGVGPAPPVSRFVVGWGVVYMSLSALETASPDLAGSLAWLVLIGALLSNGRELGEDILAGLRPRADRSFGRTSATVTAETNPATGAPGVDLFQGPPTAAELGALPRLVMRPPGSTPSLSDLIQNPGSVPRTVMTPPRR